MWHQLTKAMHAPVLLLPEEQLFLFSFIYGLKPNKVLEIGTFCGGSATIIVLAMDVNNKGHLDCIDLTFNKVTAETMQLLNTRADMYKGSSDKIVSKLEGPYDVVFIDGGHDTKTVKKDIDITFPKITTGGFMLFHDAHYSGVRNAIDIAVQENSSLMDCGLVTVSQSIDEKGVIWGGLRLVKKV